MQIGQSVLYIIFVNYQISNPLYITASMHGDGASITINPHHIASCRSTAPPPLHQGIIRHACHSAFPALCLVVDDDATCRANSSEFRCYNPAISKQHTNLPSHLASNRRATIPPFSASDHPTTTPHHVPKIRPLIVELCRIIDAAISLMFFSSLRSTR